ncbi:hypothetical protein CEV34_0688, partial [Brucella pseudogrignonensis]
MKTRGSEKTLMTQKSNFVLTQARIATLSEKADGLGLIEAA